MTMPAPKATGSHGISRPGATSAASQGARRASQRGISGERGAWLRPRPGTALRPAPIDHATPSRVQYFYATSGYTSFRWMARGRNAKHEAAVSSEDSSDLATPMSPRGRLRVRGLDLPAAHLRPGIAQPNRAVEHRLAGF